MSLLTFSISTLCSVATLTYVLCLLFSKHWFVELLTHWQLHIAAACLVCAILFYLIKYPLHAVWMLVVFLMFIMPVIKIFAPVPLPQGALIDKLTLLHYNIQYRNEEFSPQAVEWILSQNADIVVLQEVNAKRAKELGPLIKHYPWHKVEINKGRDAFSKAIFSRLPVKEYQSELTGDGYNEYGFLKVGLPSGENLHLYEIHPPPPMHPKFVRWRVQDLTTMKRVLSEDKHPYRLLVGDFNSTVYSPYFQDITQAAALHHAQQGWKIEGTWPNQLPVFMRIGIDHLLASSATHIKSRILGPFKGSDHRPVLYNLDFYK